MYGYGNSMFLATHGILARSASGGGVDPDAQAFITAASITDPTQQIAINQLVVDLKGYNIWTKMKVVYPFIGSSAGRNAYNLKNTAQYYINWNGGVTHPTTGVQFGGVNGYGDTNLNLTALNKDNIHFSFYSRTNNTTQALDMGQTGSAGNAFSLLSHYSVDLKGRTILSADGTNSLNYLNEATYTNSTGLLIGTRQNSNNIRLFRNGVKTESNTNNSVAIVNSGNIFIGARNQVSTGLAANYTNRQAAFISIGDNLTDTDAANLTTAVQAFQTILGRSIGTQTVSDADAQAFVTNAGIVDQVEANAINNLVIGLKADGLWTKMSAIYPMVGGTSTSTTYNLKNTSQYQISWVGGVTWSNNGVQFGGVNGYGNTGIIPSSVSTLNSTHMSFYSRTTFNNSGADDFGAYVGINQIQRLMIKGGSLNDHTVDMNSTSQRVSGTVTVPSGFFLANRETSTALRSLRNNVLLGSNTNTNTGTLPNIIMFLGALNNVGSAVNYSVRECAFASYGNGLTTTDETNLYSRVQTFNTALNRNV